MLFKTFDAFCEFLSAVGGSTYVSFCGPLFVRGRPTKTSAYLESLGLKDGDAAIVQTTVDGVHVRAHVEWSVNKARQLAKAGGQCNHWGDTLHTELGSIPRPERSTSTLDAVANALRSGAAERQAIHDLKPGDEVSKLDDDDQRYVVRKHEADGMVHLGHSDNRFLDLSARWETIQWSFERGRWELNNV